MRFTKVCISKNHSLNCSWYIRESHMRFSEMQIFVNRTTLRDSVKKHFSWRIYFRPTFLFLESIYSSNSAFLCISNIKNARFAVRRPLISTEEKFSCSQTDSWFTITCENTIIVLIHATIYCTNNFMIYCTTNFMLMITEFFISVWMSQISSTNYLNKSKL